MASENSKKVILGMFGLGLLAYLLYKLSRKKKEIKTVEILKQQAPTFITKKDEQKIVKKQPIIIVFEVIDRY